MYERHIRVEQVYLHPKSLQKVSEIGGKSGQYNSIYGRNMDKRCLTPERNSWVG